MIGGRAGDTIGAGAGNNVVIGDSGTIVTDLSVPGPAVTWKSIPTQTPADGGKDTITTLGGADVVLGGAASDWISAGAGTDTVLGDNGLVTYKAGVIVTVQGTDTDKGDTDTIYAGDGDDVVIGGRGDDAIDGGAGEDLIFGDNTSLDRTATLGNSTNPRFRALAGTQIYSTATDATAGNLLTDASKQYVDPRGATAWSDFQITLLDNTAATASNLFGNDYIAGGAGDDQIFGELGDDVIQGDGSIDFLSGGGRVGAYRDANNELHLSASFAAAGDGDDYVEGGGGNDVIFGNDGQDDIIGGNSSLFSLTSERAASGRQRHDLRRLRRGGRP